VGNKKLSSGVNLRTIARQTIGLTGADLENIMNEAAIFAAKRGRKAITQKDLTDSVEKVTIGAEKKSRKLSKKERDITAYHELGHAIVGHLCPESDPLHKISIVSRGSALGITWFLPKEDEYTISKSKFIDQICGLLAGRAAEELIFNEVTTGASNDLEHASQIARNMAMRFGMGDDSLGLVAYGERQGAMFMGVEPTLSRNYSEDIQRHIDEYVRDVIRAQYDRAMGMLKAHREKIDEIAQVLLKKETLSVTEFLKMFEEKKS